MERVTFKAYTPAYVPSNCSGPSFTTDLYAVGRSIETLLKDAATHVRGACWFSCIGRLLLCTIATWLRVYAGRATTMRMTVTSAGCRS
jgi:hypothetical protein